MKANFQSIHLQHLPDMYKTFFRIFFFEKSTLLFIISFRKFNLFFYINKKCPVSNFIKHINKNLDTGIYIKNKYFKLTSDRNDEHLLT